MAHYEVIVGNVGCFSFDSESEAEKWFDDYVELSKTDKGHRVYGEDVTIIEHTGVSSDIILEYRGHLAQNEEGEF